MKPQPDVVNIPADMTVNQLSIYLQCSRQRSIGCSKKGHTSIPTEIGLAI
jgi:hypothetical protein